MNELNKLRLQKAQKFAKLLANFSFIKLVAITGSLAKFNSTRHSDIDIFVIVEKGKIWTARALALAASQFLGQRAKGKDSAGKFCFNRFVSDDYLSISPRNFYHAQEYGSFLVLVDKNNTLEKFTAKNLWIGKCHKFNFNCDHQIKIKNIAKKPIFPQKLNLLLEKYSRDYQAKKFLTNKFYHQPGSKLVYNDQEIYFFLKPR
ncbi:MAG: nucleotidyltransferase domain-containing protein [Patescibacteria group bacterium]|nr:nucleotidyltransferase domain-containing protein [Patescibacteria group bacterium]